MEVPELPAPRSRPFDQSFELATEIQPVSGYNRLGVGAYVAVVVATAINCKKADVVTLAINVGSHIVDDERHQFTVFDADDITKIDVNKLLL